MQMGEKERLLGADSLLKYKPVRSKKCLFKPSRWEAAWNGYEAAVLVNLNTGIYYTINQTVERIWRDIDGKRSVNALAAKAARAFHVKKAKIMPDVTQTLRMLEKSGLIKWKRRTGKKAL